MYAPVDSNKLYLDDVTSTDSTPFCWVYVRDKPKKSQCYQIKILIAQSELKINLFAISRPEKQGRAPRSLFKGITTKPVEIAKEDRSSVASSGRSMEI